VKKMEKKSEVLMTRREALKSAGKISVSALVASTIPGIIANASETLPKATIYLTERSKLRCLCTVLRMGHCAPSVMSTLIDGRRNARYEHMIEITSGMPEGIGRIGAECGAVTSPIMFLGRKLGYDTSNGETPMVITLGRRYVNMFRDLHGSIYCRDIRTPDSGISPCRKAICGARGLLVKAIDGDSGVLSGRL
jgi:C_GCAxxG_C_C family probable redox protein